MSPVLFLKALCALLPEVRSSGVHLSDSVLALSLRLPRTESRLFNFNHRRNCIVLRDCSYRKGMENIHSRVKNEKLISQARLIHLIHSFLLANRRSIEDAYQHLKHV